MNQALLSTGLGVILLMLLIGHPAIADPYAWANWQNMCYNSLGRCAFTVGVVMTFIPMLMGHFNYGLDFVCSSNFRFIGCAVYIVCVVHPIVIALLYNTSQDPMYISFPVVLYLGLGNVFCETIIGLLLYIVFEHPFRTIINVIGLRGYQEQNGALDHKYHAIKPAKRVATVDPT